MKGCPLVPATFGTRDLCDWCGADLPRTKAGGIAPGRRWCSPSCSNAYWDNHQFANARSAALSRDDYRCVKCGDAAGTTRSCSACGAEWPCDREGRAAGKDYWGRDRIHKMRVTVGRLEVNHIEPRKGMGYLNSCAHHLAGLETLCRPCHVAVTQEQLRNWRPPAPSKPPRGVRPDRPSEAPSWPLWEEVAL